MRGREKKKVVLCATVSMTLALPPAPVGACAMTTAHRRSLSQLPCPPCPPLHLPPSPPLFASHTHTSHFLLSPVSTPFLPLSASLLRLYGITLSHFIVAPTRLTLAIVASYTRSFSPLVFLCSAVTTPVLLLSRQQVVTIRQRFSIGPRSVKLRPHLPSRHSFQVRRCRNTHSCSRIPHHLSAQHPSRFVSILSCPHCNERPADNVCPHPDSTLSTSSNDFSASIDNSTPAPHPQT